MSFIPVTVYGKQHNASLETPMVDGKARARIRVNGRTVRGKLSINSNGVKRFMATGPNANLLK
jgi:hypothetical protein